MIISASRRTDIPAFYAEWFINRLKARYALVRNPFNANQISKVFLHPDQIECIVFWTKNPAPLIKKIHEIDNLGFKYYFHFTVTSYDQSIEINLPRKKVIINTFQELSRKIGSEKVIWRYDPILITSNFNVEYHEKWFRYLAENLCGFTNKCVFSFIHIYKKCKRNLKNIRIEKIDDDVKIHLATSLRKSARDFGMSIEACAEPILSSFGVNAGRCIDDQLISKIIGDQITINRDKAQRQGCGCVKSIDIGSYNTCKHNCKYCYANNSDKTVIDNCKNHDVSSPLQTGSLDGDEVIRVRKTDSFRSKQMGLFP